MSKAEELEKRKSELKAQIAEAETELKAMEPVIDCLQTEYCFPLYSMGERKLIRRKIERIKVTEHNLAAVAEEVEGGSLDRY